MTADCVADSVLDRVTGLGVVPQLGQDLRHQRAHQARGVGPGLAGVPLVDRLPRQVVGPPVDQGTGEGR